MTTDIESAQIVLPRSIREKTECYRTKLAIVTKRTCACPANNLNGLPAKEWLKSQIGVWQFFYEGRDIRDKNLHPATFPISLAKKVISLFTHEGELVLDPFVGSGTTLVAAQGLNRNVVGFDLQGKSIVLLSRIYHNHKDFAVSSSYHQAMPAHRTARLCLLIVPPGYAWLRRADQRSAVHSPVWLRPEAALWNYVSKD